MSARYAIGFDLGGTNLKAALVASTGAIIAKKSEPSQAGKGPAYVCARMAAIRDELLLESGVERGRCLGIGVGTPGPLDFKAGVITKAANLPGWQNVPIRRLLSECTDMPVMVENDANAAAYGEWWMTNPADRSDLVLLTLGTGVGAGVIIGGSILHGHFDNAGELGHMIVVMDGLSCPCGQRGCLEQYSSASGLARRVQNALEGGQGSTVRRRSDGPPECLDVVDAARAKDPLCEALFDEACRFLATACVNIQHVYNPARIFLGGGLAEAGDFLLERVRRHFERIRWSLHTDWPAIEPARLGNDAGLIGAAALVFSQAGAEGMRTEAV